MNDAQDEIARLREEVAELRKALGEKRQQLSAPNLPSLVNDEEFVLAMVRFSEGLEGYSEKEVRKRYHFDEATWEALGNDDALIERIEEVKIARLRSGATKRELAQAAIIRGPNVLATIMDDPKANARHRVDSIKALNAIADPGPEAAAEQERIFIKIDLSADTK